jgi:hypothetical protein
MKPTLLGRGGGLGPDRVFRSREAADESQFLKRVFSRIIVTIAQRIGQEFTARVTHAPQIDLRFGDAAGQL